MNEQKLKIFISYSWEDKTISRKLADFLRRDGAQVWIDYSENKAGDSFIKKMNSGLEWCDTFVLLWSKSAANSNFVSMEWEGALANNLKIIPCLIDKTKLPFILSGHIYKDLSYFDEGYNSLIEDLNLVIKEEKPKEVEKVVKTLSKKVDPKPEIDKPKVIIFRSNPKELSVNDVKSMLAKYKFFDNRYNKNSKGFNHQYKQKTFNGDKVVIDNASGLIWQQGGSYRYIKFKSAASWIKKLNQNRFTGFNDWRLPTLEEAMSLMEPEKNGDLYIDPVFDVKQRWIWTADQFEAEWRAAWIVNFTNGFCYNTTLNYNYYVRAVRFGQSSTE